MMYVYTKSPIYKVEAFIRNMSKPNYVLQCSASKNNTEDNIKHSRSDTIMKFQDYLYILSYLIVHSQICMLSQTQMMRLFILKLSSVLCATLNHFLHNLTSIFFEEFWNLYSRLNFEKCLWFSVKCSTSTSNFKEVFQITWML